MNDNASSSPARSGTTESGAPTSPDDRPGVSPAEEAADKPPEIAAAIDPPHRRNFLSWLRGLRRRPNGDQVRDTIEELIDVGATNTDAALKPNEGELIRNILHLNKLTVEDVMVPRADIIGVEVGTSLDGLIEILAKETHSRLPVYKDNLDGAVGMVHIKDVVPCAKSPDDFSLERIKRDVLFAAPSMNVLDLLTEMRATRIHMALIVDEFGGIDGLVSIEDLVEEIVGDIEDEHDQPEELEINEVRAGVAVADARLPVEDLEEAYGPLLSDTEREDIDTLGGLVFSLAGRVPARGELIAHPSGLEIEIMDADPRRIHRLRLRNLPPRLTVDQADE